VHKSKKKGKIQDLTDQRRPLSEAREMLDSTLTPDRAMPKLQMKHQSLYKWRTYCGVCIPVKSIGGVYSILKAVPKLGRNVSMIKDDRAATT
jgi:hypothetical protein